MEIVGKALGEETDTVDLEVGRVVWGEFQIDA